MRTLVAGATGAVGRALVPELVRRGHEVAGLSRCPDDVASLGARPLVADSLDPESVHAAFQAFRPEAVIHQLTSLPKDTGLWNFDKAFRETNRLRTEGTDNLIAASRAVGVGRFVAQGFAGWPSARIGGPVKTEDDPLDSDPPRQLRSTLEALRYLEAAVTGADDLRGTVLRYGSFYGPNTHFGGDSAMAKQVRKRRLPLIGDGGGIWSFTHIRDVATATATAVEGDAGGVFNVVDDDPAPVSDWLPELARIMGAPAPFRVPAWLTTILLPEHLRIMMTEVRGASNGRFKTTFEWKPEFPSWRAGFASEFG